MFGIGPQTWLRGSKNKRRDRVDAYGQHDGFNVTLFTKGTSYCRVRGMGDNELNVIDHAGNPVAGEHEDGRSLQRIFEVLGSVDMRLGNFEKLVAGMGLAIVERQPEKEWYTTAELADLLGKSDFTVREKWCNQGRIECEKHPDSGKWRIPAHEVHRLQNGGALKPKNREADR